MRNDSFSSNAGLGDNYDRIRWDDRPIDDSLKPTKEVIKPIIKEHKDVSHLPPSVQGLVKGISKALKSDEPSATKDFINALRDAEAERIAREEKENKDSE